MLGSIVRTEAIMAIHQTIKQTDLEKRLRLLRQQIYGRLESHPSDTPTLRHADTQTHDLIFLYQDLTKIGLLTSLAIGLQIVLFILIKNHVLNLNFF